MLRRVFAVLNMFDIDQGDMAKNREILPLSASANAICIFFGE
jgi:hypothetical protein